MTTSESARKQWITRRQRYGVTGKKNGKNLPRLSELDKMWLACVVDTEGCVGRAGKWNQLRVQIEMTSEAFMRKVSRLVAQEIEIRDYNPSKNPKWSRSYRVQLSGEKAKNLLLLLSPYLIIKEMPS